METDCFTAVSFTLFRMSLFGTALRWWGGGEGGRGGGKKGNHSLKSIIPILNQWKSYTLSKRDPKNVWFTWHTPWVQLISVFFTENKQILLYQEIQIYIPFYLTFIESLKVFLINIVTILIISAKISTPDFLKIKVFGNNGYDVIIYVNDITNKISSRYSNYIVDVVMWPIFDSSIISMREFTITLIL